MIDQEEMMKFMRDYEYDTIAMGEDEAIEILDRWLEDWLYRKDVCPNCGIYD